MRSLFYRFGGGRKSFSYRLDGVRGLWSYRCNSSSPFVKVSKRYQKSVTKDFKIFPGGNGSVRLAVKQHTSKQIQELLC